jgi:hypothetical protein
MKMNSELKAWVIAHPMRDRLLRLPVARRQAMFEQSKFMDKLWKACLKK